MLTLNFSLAEFTRSQTATRQEIDNSLPETLLMDAVWFAETILEAIRELVGVPVRISSGYRCPELNQRIGGSGKSYHMKAMASDILVDRLSPLELAQEIRDSDLSFDKLILEYNAWVHIQGRREDSRGKILTAYRVDGKTKYRRGIVRLQHS